MNVSNKTIRQLVSFKASPHEVYEALMDSRKHSIFSGSVAKIGKKVGEPFSAFDGYAYGKNVSLEPDKKIVQLWRAEEEGWPKGHFSKVTFALKKTARGTVLAFTQTGVPEAVSKSISDGWREFYWQPMKRMLEG